MNRPILRWALQLVTLLALLGAAVPVAAQAPEVRPLPADVYATLDAVVARYPHTGDDEDRRAAMEKVVATVRARHGLRWVWKTEHASLIAPSKDGLGYVPEGDVVHGQRAEMFIWDTISGGTRRPYPAPLMSVHEGKRPAYVLAVAPHDWLADGAPVPPPTTPPVTPGLPAPLPEGIAAALARLAEQLDALTAKVDHLAELAQTGADQAAAARVGTEEARAQLLALLARPWPTYRGSNRYLGAFTLTPQ